MRNASATTAEKPQTTFSCHDVTNDKTRLPTEDVQTAVARLIAGGTKVDNTATPSVIGCSAWSRPIIADFQSHALLNGIHAAFANHLPLRLTPDSLWVTILQGVAQHIVNHPTEIAEKVIGRPFDGTREVIPLSINRSLIRGPDEDWPHIVSMFSNELTRRHPLASRMLHRFSTTDAASYVAQQISVMSAFEPFYKYVLICVCGIPTITLEGTIEDWREIRNRVDAFSELGLEWWLGPVRKILDQFIAAVEGKVDRTFWCDIIKQKEQYGGNVLNGWACQLVPYLKDKQSGAFDVPNPLLKNPMAAISSDSFPTGLASADVKIVDYFKSPTATYTPVTFGTGFAPGFRHGQRLPR